MNFSFLFLYTVPFFLAFYISLMNHQKYINNLNNDHHNLNDEEEGIHTDTEYNNDVFTDSE